MNKIKLAILALASLPAIRCAGETSMAPLIPELQQHHIGQALDALVMTPADARFDKDLGKPVWALGWVTNALQDPWRFPDAAEKLFSAASSRDAEQLWKICAVMMELPELEAKRGGEKLPHEQRPESLASDFYSRARLVAEDLNDAFAGLSPADRIYLAASIFAPAFETEDDVESRPLIEAAGMPRSVQERVELESRTLDGTANAKSWLALVSKIDRARIHRAGHALRAAVEEIMRDAQTFTNWPASPKSFETPLGRIMIGTTGDDQYENAALLILDPGGDDLYSGASGAANGLSGQPVAAIADLGGDDRYCSSQLIGPSGALLGVACMMDASGDDFYRCEGIGLGSSVFGAAWLEDSDGKDLYKARAFSEGSGVAGFGFLVDRNGDDSYDVGFQGQGFSGVMGWGILLDEQGHDRYDAGRVLRDHERNDDRFLSLSQGFSIGMRPHAGGGVAALIDLQGNDSYQADVYGQGVSYYYSTGFLMDAGGNDTYQMYQYGQGCGIHMSLGLLADASGSDMYTGYILAQGAAHDYSVGFLFDHAGDDTYTADHHAQGRALNNAFALLLDRSGTDGYFARQRGEAQGIGNTGGFRDYGSLGLLVDLRGADIYSGGMSNNITTIRPLYGVVYDREAGDEK